MTICYCVLRLTLFVLLVIFTPMNPTGNVASLAKARENSRLANKFRGMSQAELDSFLATSLDKTSRKIAFELRRKDYSSVPLSQLTVALDTCVKSARLLRGQSTGNLAIAGRVDAIVKVQALAGRLESSLALGPQPDSGVLMAGNNGSYTAESQQIVECEAVEPTSAVPVKRRGRPRKVQPAE